MTRISSKFQDLRSKGQKGFIAYITAGDPDLETTRKLVLEFDRRGVDLVELGVPFSDPIADGPVNQEAAQRALRHHVSVGDILDMMGGLRRDSDIPIVLFTYCNPIFQYGLERFADKAKIQGVDGVLLLDVPPEEGGEYKQMMDRVGLDTIFLIAPTTPDARIRTICDWASGFVYYVSRTGVTGERKTVAESIGPKVRQIHQYTDKPVGVGFGISSPAQAVEVSHYADAVIVGSAIVRRIKEHIASPQLIRQIGEFVETLSAPLKGERHG